LNVNNSVAQWGGAAFMLGSLLFLVNKLNEMSRHFGDGSVESDLDLSSGTHTLCLQAADGAHIALEGEGMTDAITLFVP